jgi:type IV pilus assembly protein PilW
LQIPSAGFPLKAIKCDAAPELAPIRQYVRRIFFVDQNNIAGDGIPTLKRVDHGANGTLGTPVALVEGIDDMHFEYAIDNDDNGSADVFKETPAVAELPNIVGVRVWLIARAIDRSPGYTDGKTYQLGTKAAYQPTDGFKRHVFNTYVELEHPVARRAK